MDIERIERIDVIPPPPPVETGTEEIPEDTKIQKQSVTETPEPERVVDLFA
ncbi:MAG: hypothetical protein JXB88_10445 [Spirochaetales bacterium]|nr:hypothetical protein [Spirochaetales bacterium]